MFLAVLAVGIVLGLAGAAAGGRLLQDLLFGVTPLGPQTFGAVALLSASSPARHLTCLPAARRASIRWSRSEANKGASP